jgi:undecaprenyl-diphosphatase
VSIWQAIIMGLVQGLGEFLPISSSGHLILVPWIFNWPEPGLTFDVALHIGTLLAVVLYFWRDWLNLFAAAITGRNKENRRIFWYLVFGSIPAAVIGYLFDDFIEKALRSPLIIGGTLIVFGLFLYLSDRNKELRSLDSMNLYDALLIGVAQAIALVPGVSRSGITITAARMFSYKREDAARFSFLLSTPVIFGAGILKMAHLSLSEVTAPFLTGVLVSAVVGLLCISFLLRFVKKASFKVFVGYRVILGLVIIVLFFLGMK